MNEMDYEQIIEQALQRFVSLVDQRETLDHEIAKMMQFIYATVHLLSEDATERFVQKWQPYLEQVAANTTSLTDAVRNTLRSCYPKKLTAAQVLNQLRTEGFNFSSYKSDPLPSVSTTLRRLKEANEIIADEFEGVAVYQAKPQKTLKRTFKMPYGRTVPPPPGIKDSAMERFKQAHDALEARKKAKQDDKV